MAQLSISAAARAAGKDRGTIQRYIKNGKLSVSKDAAGNTIIETSELLRVFGALTGSGSRAAAVQHVAAPAENSSVQHVLEATLELLKQQLNASQEREARLLVMLEQEQQSRRDLEQRLLPPGSSAGSNDPGEETDAPVGAETAATAEVSERDDGREGGKGFLAKLFGRG